MNALQQFLQAASNEAAGAVSGPVDLIGMGLRKLGVPVPRNALMSSDWMRQNGLMQDVPQNAASLAGQTFGLLSPVVAAAKAPQIARGLLTMGENAAAPKNVSRGASAGQRGIFMGDLSKTWDKSAAAKALEMEKAGADPRAIWQETGTFKGVDGKWRQEIDDSAAELVDVPSVPRQFFKEDGFLSRGLEGIVEHPAVFDSYQRVEGFKPLSRVKTDAAINGQGGGAYLSKDFGEEMIDAAGWSPKDLRSTLLHEMQHAIQARQGFSRGGGDFRLAGEAEARAVQKRMNMNPLQRRETFPLDSYDVPINELIVRR